jgi:hypothetical protein
MNRRKVALKGVPAGSPDPDMFSEAEEAIPLEPHEWIGSFPRPPAAVPLEERIRRIGPELSAATDSLNERLAKAEESLRGLNLGVAAAVPMMFSDDEGWSEDLAFRKHENSWRLMFDSNYGGDPQHDTSVPLLNARREARLEATEHLDELLEALIAAAEAESRKVAESIRAVDSFVARVQALGARK